VKLQERILEHAAHPMMFWAVMILTICESIFLFIPPEVFMTPPIVADKKRAVPIVVAASVGSLIGGAIAYAVGLWLYDTIGIWIINFVSSPESFEMAKTMFDKYGLLVIFMAAFTPVPYKFLAIAAGFLGYNPWLFIGVSAIFRTGRFALVGFLLWKFQRAANEIVKKYFWPLTALAVIAAGLGVLLIL
jgi:membrane protein YqaA with SNARE-associated domain